MLVSLFFFKLYIHFYMLHFIICLKSVTRKESKEKKKAKNIIKREDIEIAKQG